MKQFFLKTKILQFKNCRELCEYFKIGEGDIVFISERCYRKYFEKSTRGAEIIFRGNYGSGEPTDVMVEKINKDIKSTHYKRVFAIGGGTVIDVAKLFALKQYMPVSDLFYSKTIVPEKEKELIVIPTTCGTGSEVTNISILELTKLETKLGLADDAIFPDYAALVPELLEDLPHSVFVTSSIDALIHATESFLSPKATCFSKNFSMEAIRLILSGYKVLVEKGMDYRIQLNDNFLLASTYGGIAFGNAGTGAVHAMSYPLGAKYHVSHGEANYAIFTEVLKKYKEKNSKGSIKILNMYMANILECKIEEVYENLEELLNKLLPKKRLQEYGVKEEELIAFTENVMTKQGRLMANNYVVLEEEDIYQMYKALY